MIFFSDTPHFAAVIAISMVNPKISPLTLHAEYRRRR
jgi:hypothetical protein